MPLQHSYSLNKIDPIYPGAMTQAVRFAPNLTLRAGALLAVITASAVNAKQTIAISGSPTGGTFTLTYKLQTAVVPYNATAAQVKTLLEALPTIGPGNVSVTGGALPGTNVVVEFIGAMAGVPIATMTYSGAGLTGGSPSLSVTTTQTGVSGGRMVAYDGSLLAGPTVAPTVAGNGSGSSYGAGTYAVQVTYVNAMGETLPSPAVNVTITAAQNLRVSAISSLDASITAVYVYVNGRRSGTMTVTSQTAAQTDISGATVTGQAPPSVSSAYVYSDGRHKPRFINMWDIATDDKGTVAVSIEGAGRTYLTGEVYSTGQFRVADLTGLDLNAIQNNLFARELFGSYNSTDGVIQLL